MRRRWLTWRLLYADFLINETFKWLVDCVASGRLETHFQKCTISHSLFNVSVLETFQRISRLSAGEVS